MCQPLSRLAFVRPDRERRGTRGQRKRYSADFKMLAPNTIASDTTPAMSYRSAGHGWRGSRKPANRRRNFLINSCNPIPGLPCEGRSREPCGVRLSGFHMQWLCTRSPKPKPPARPGKPATKPKEQVPARSQFWLAHRAVPGHIFRRRSDMYDAAVPKWSEHQAALLRRRTASERWHHERQSVMSPASVTVSSWSCLSPRHRLAA